MQPPKEYPVEERIIRALEHLGLKQAHFAARSPEDWIGLATHYPESIASLLLICPIHLNPRHVAHLADRLFVFTGDQPIAGEMTVSALEQLPTARHLIIPGYVTMHWTDVVAECAAHLAPAMIEFLTGTQNGQRTHYSSLPEGVGEVAGVSYHIRGTGEPLVLLPLSLAPSGWDPLVEQLSEQFCTIVLGGVELGVMPFLEQRGRAVGYLRLIRNLFEEIELKPGELVLDVGCGSGVIERWVAHRTQGQNSIWGVDINAYLLKEAQALARKEQLDQLLVFQEGHAERLPFPEHHFDVTFSITVMEEVNADQMLAELIRVTKPGGRIGVIVRAMDLPRTINVPLRQELKAHLEPPPWPGEGNACASASLYRRFRHAKLTDLRLWPQLAVFDNAYGAVEQFVQNSALARFSADEAQEYLSAREQAIAEGTFFITWPHHCAVGTKVVR
jgi:SAM-dependent methyltransferase